MDIVIKVIQFILSFSLLVIVHELGHFLFAKMFKVRVERFQLFFGKAWLKFRKGDTEYGIGFIPFGGFVKLSGMIDESLDTDQMKQEPQPYEFRTKPAWQRFLIMIGGVFMNVVLAFVIYVGMSFTWGDKYISNADMKYGCVFNEVAEGLGFQDGDKVISIGGELVEDFSKILPAIMIEPDRTTVVERDGELVTIEIPTQSVMDFAESPDFVSPRFQFVINNVAEVGGAQQAGIIIGDRLVSFDGESTEFFDQYQTLFNEHKGEIVEMGVERVVDDVKTVLYLPIQISDEGIIGVNVDFSDVFKLNTRDYTFWQAIPVGFKRVGSEIGDYWKQLKMIFQPKTEMYKALGGPLSIGNIFPSSWNWEHFWNITALLSIVLAVMNILPIPALDGGHVLFLLYEIITRRKPSDKFLIRAQTVGMLLIFTLMIYATWNDIVRFFIK